MSTTTIIEGLTTRLKVGLEIHVELATRSKMWTAAPNVAHPDYFNAEPNTLLDPVVIGLPGSLPVMNRAALEMSIKVGLALGCRIAPFTKWDRKSYYYPDLPKNYQISQYDLPLCSDGSLTVPAQDGSEGQPIRILRAHLEEDAGKLLHEAPGGFAIDESIIDLNRAGTPLLEIVTHPDFDTAEQVVAFGQALRNICRFLGVTEGIMQKGHMRFEPNINVLIERDGSAEGGFATPIVEIKNLNSFRAVHGAITYEHHRQVEQWLKDGRLMTPGTKSTRGWDDVKQQTFLQREKEEAHDYRYFPDPDLLPVVVDEPWLERIRAEIPELPLSRKRRYVEEYGLEDVDANAIVSERAMTMFFEECVRLGLQPVRAAKVMLNSLVKLANKMNRPLAEFLEIRPELIAPRHVVEVEKLRDQNLISSNAADQLYGFLLASEADSTKSVEQIARDYDFLQVADESLLDAWVSDVIRGNPKVVDQIKAGNEKAIMSLVGGVMKLSKGKANPKVVQEKLRQRIL